MQNSLNVKKINHKNDVEVFMKNIFSRFHSLTMIIVAAALLLPASLNANNPTTLINQYSDSKAMDALFNKALQESSTINSQAVISALQRIVYNFCSWPELFQLKTFITNNGTLLTKLPYVGLATLYEFTEQVKKQIHEHQAKMSAEASSNLKKACNVIQMAILKVLEKIREISLYAANLETIVHKTSSPTITVQDFLNKTSYTQLQECLTAFVNSQIAALSLEMPQDLRTAILSEQNITTTFNQALSKTLATTLTTTEIATFKQFMLSAPVTTLFTKSSHIIDLMTPILTPIASKFRAVAAA